MQSNDESSIRCGSLARLSGIRAALGSEDLWKAALEPFLSDNNNDPLWQSSVKLSWQMEESVTQAEGYLIVTQEACLFCSKGGVDEDWFVPATAITLHALTDEASESIGSVYVQMENEQDEENPIIEWNILVGNLSSLYEALSELVSLHPIDPHQDTNAMEGEEDDENFEPEDMIWASDIRVKEEEDDQEGATEEERQAMLDRLDQVLTVPPELEIKDKPEPAEGQFDDAEDDDDVDKIL